MLYQNPVIFYIESHLIDNMLLIKKDDFVKETNRESYKFRLDSKCFVEIAEYT